MGAKTYNSEQKGLKTVLFSPHSFFPLSLLLFSLTRSFLFSHFLLSTELVFFSFRWKSFFFCFLWKSYFFRSVWKSYFCFLLSLYLFCSLRNIFLCLFYSMFVYIFFFCPLWKSYFFALYRSRSLCSVWKEQFK